MNRSAPTLTGLQIRAKNSDDWQEIAQICRALPPTDNPLGLAFFSNDFAKEELGKPTDQLTTFGLAAELDGHVVGELMLQRRSGRQRHIGRIQRFIVAPQIQGRGVGGALLDAALDLGENSLNLTRIDHLIPKESVPALTVHRKRGFIVEGELQDYYFRGGRYLSVYVMARVRDAF
jgi:RimJ/RimL family protein N-acetyltransferase